MVADPEPEIDALARFLGVEASPQRYAHIDRRSAYVAPLDLHPQVRAACLELEAALAEIADDLPSKGHGGRTDMSLRGGQGNGVVVRQSFFSGGMASIAVATGLLLDVVAAAVFGAGRDTDAFVAAARFPLALTAILMLLSTQVLVPTFTTWEATLETKRAKRLVTSTLLRLRRPGLGGGGSCWCSRAVPMVAVMAPGFEDSQRALAADLLRIMVWTIPLTAGLRGAPGLAELPAHVRRAGGDDGHPQPHRGRHRRRRPG